MSYINLPVSLDLARNRGEVRTTSCAGIYKVNWIIISIFQFQFVRVQLLYSVICLSLQAIGGHKSLYLLYEPQELSLSSLC